MHVEGCISTSRESIESHTRDRMRFSRRCQAADVAYWRDTFIAQVLQPRKILCCHFPQVFATEAVMSLAIYGVDPTSHPNDHVNSTRQNVCTAMSS